MLTRSGELLNTTKDASFERQDFMVLLGDGRREKIALIKPLTYMNRSGEVVRSIVKMTGDDFDRATDLIVLHDELDIALGRVKVDFGASAAGHNGVKNIVDQLGTKEFIRVRMGIKPGLETGDVRIEEFVLERFSGAEMDTVNELVVRAAEAAYAVLSEGLTKAQEQYNQKAA